MQETYPVKFCIHFEKPYLLTDLYSFIRIMALLHAFRIFFPGNDVSFFFIYIEISFI